MVAKQPQWRPDDRHLTSATLLITDVGRLPPSDPPAVFAGMAICDLRFTGEWTSHGPKRHWRECRYDVVRDVHCRQSNVSWPSAPCLTTVRTECESMLTISKGMCACSPGDGRGTWNVRQHYEGATHSYTIRLSHRRVFGRQNVLKTGTPSRLRLVLGAFVVGSVRVVRF